MDIETYLDAATRRPWIYGGGQGGFEGHDCTLFVANWVLAYCGKDPADHQRGRYKTQEQAQAILNRAGGFFGLLAAPLVDIGWRAVQHHASGDVAVLDLSAKGESIQLPAIRLGGLWLSIEERRNRPFAVPGSAMVRMAWRGCAA